MPMIVKAFAYDACHVPKPLIYNCDIKEKIGRKPAESRLNTDRYKHGERSMPVFISTVMNMENGRCQGRRITFLFDNQRYYQKKYYLYT